MNFQSKILLIRDFVLTKKLRNNQASFRKNSMYLILILQNFFIQSNTDIENSDTVFFTIKVKFKYYYPSYKNRQIQINYYL